VDRRSALPRGDRADPQQPPQVRFAAATTGSANLLIAVAATDLNALYNFLTTKVGPLSQITGVEITPLLATAKRTGLPRRNQPAD
jgi:hypothetical protein